MIALVVAFIGLVAGTAGSLLLLKAIVSHTLAARDAEWEGWARDRGITDGFPGYGYKRKETP